MAKRHEDNPKRSTSRRASSPKAAKTQREAAVAVAAELGAAGHTALLAGGCVRDELLGRSPKDYDVATSATPDEVLRVFPRARTVGAQFGVVLARRFRHTVEVATFRSDGEYRDGRRPESVRFGDAAEDARRRDFTINGLFQDPKSGEVIDYVGGVADLEAKRVRTIGDPDLRFGEDHLRLLRAVRFAANLDFVIDEETFASIRRNAAKLARISPERIWMELEKILAGPARARGWRLLLESGLREFLCDAWPANPAADARATSVLEHLPGESGVELRVALPLAAVVRGPARATVAAVANGLKLSNRLRLDTLWLRESLGAARQAAELELADLKVLMNHECRDALLILLRAELEAAGESLEPYESLRDRMEGIDEDAIAPPPLLTGDDLQAAGFAPSPKFGRVLDAIYRDQLNEKLVDKDEALGRAKELLEE